MMLNKKYCDPNKKTNNRFNLFYGELLNYRNITGSIHLRYTKVTEAILFILKRYDNSNKLGTLPRFSLSSQLSLKCPTPSSC